MLEALLFIVGVFLAWSLVHWIRLQANGLGLIDVPNDRSMHNYPIPRGGGAAIVLVCLLGVALAGILGLNPGWAIAIGYVGGVLLVAAASMFDDFRTLPVAVRLLAQVVGAVVMLIALKIDWPNPSWLTATIGFLWIVGLTNAYNFMDGIDGLAASYGVVAGLTWSVLASIADERWLAVLALLVAASCGGFLIHNWAPARIFMGDVGSAFLGLTFAFMALAVWRRSHGLALAGALLMWPLVFDASFTMVRRLIRGENIFHAHRSHLYQRLVVAGWSQAVVASIYVCFALVMTALATLMWKADSQVVSESVLAAAVLMSIGYWALVSRHERRARQAAEPRPTMRP